MRLALTTNARLYKNSKGEYYTTAVYGYPFFKRYLNVFEEIKLIAHVERVDDQKINGMLRVDGERLSVYEIFFPHGKLNYIKNYQRINRELKYALNDVDAVILRVPDQLAFQVYKQIRGRIPLAIEVTSHSWELFRRGTTNKSIFRPFIRIYWHHMQKKLCKNANGTAYVTKKYLQQDYPYQVGEKYFTTYYTSADIDEDWFYTSRRQPNKNEVRLIHTATSIGGTGKGHKELLIAAGELLKKGHPIKVVLIGGGVLNSANKQIVEQYGLQNNIEFKGTLNKKQIQQELSNADIFVFPSYTEGLPRAVIEAMAAGLPCVATQLPGIKELVDKKWLVPVKDSTLLVEKLEEFIKNEDLRIEVGRLNRENAKEYGIVNVTKKRVEFYTKLKNLSEQNKNEKN